MDPSYDEAKLQKVADLMTDIYTVLANSTFIPHNAITLGPHTINKTALPCKPHAAVLRLIKLLPYVDVSLVETDDWFDGGSFMDYRNPEHLAELCDPLRGQSFGWTDYMSPDDVALTNWGTGGWNNDRTFVMIYNTARNSIRAYDGEEWLERRRAKDLFSSEMNEWWFEEADEYGTWDRTDGAPLVLRAIVSNFRSLLWTPWAMSNKEDGFGVPFGVPTDHIKELLRQNGWPNTFNSTQFRADFTRAKHKPSGKGDAEA
jgi:uncharacterized protein (UPF0297 family)